MPLSRRSLLAASAAMATLPAAAAPAVAAEASQIRLSHGYGLHFIPLMVIRHFKLLEKHVARLGLGPKDISWRIIDGGSSINDAMIAGALDIAGIGATGFITLWAKARNIPSQSVVGLTALGGGATWLMSNKPSLRSLRDFTDQDRIAVPGIKTSYAAVLLEMAAAKEFGIEHYDQIDHLTVGLGHPDALAVLVSGHGEIDAHMASPPFSNREATYPNIHRVFTSTDVIGRVTIDVVYAPKRFAEANPGIMTAFVAASDEANALINNDRSAAADAYLAASELTMKKADVVELLSDPETFFQTEPSGVMTYADFLGKTGTIKVTPASWKDLFIAQLHDRTGS